MSGACDRRAELDGQAGGCVHELRHYEPGLEADVVSVLARVHGGAWGDEDLWLWKHPRRPNFDPRDVWIAYADGEPVGCFHFALLPITLEDGLTLWVSVDGDFAVVPEHRRYGTPIEVIDRTDPEQRRRGAVLRGGFTSEELNDRFYTKQFGQVFVPAVTTQYRKILGPGPLAAKVHALGESLLAKRRVQRALAARPWVVALEVESFPPCTLTLSGDAFHLERGAHPRPNVRLAMPYAVLPLLADSPGVFAKAVLSGLVKRRVRLAGLVRALPRAAATAWAFLTG